MKQQPVLALPFGTAQVECMGIITLQIRTFQSLCILLSWYTRFLNSNSVIWYFDGRTSVGHMDSPNIVDIGLAQMLTLVVEQNSNAELDVFILL